MLSAFHVLNQIINQVVLNYYWGEAIYHVDAEN